ncbi:MAG TPA: YceI family protein, partial [Acidimicrobiia bacterium]
MTATDTVIPGYIAGNWTVDTVHSEVGFTVRHLMVSKVRGHFTDFTGTLVTGENVLDSSVEATIQLASIDTSNADRDAHVRSADFFDVEQYPTLTYRSTGIRAEGDGFVVDGELSLHGVTREVPLALEVNGFQASTPFGDTRA